MIQKEIDKILVSARGHSQKLDDLRSLFIAKGIRLFSDLDDTIGTKTTCFQAKIKILKFLKKGTNENIYEKVLGEFKLNNKFADTLKKHNLKGNLVILSRNGHQFTKRFVAKYKTTFLKHGINIVGVVAVVGKYDSKVVFDLNIDDKLKMLPNGSKYIADIFEYRLFDNYEGFISVDPAIFFFKIINIIIYKLFISFTFLLRNV